MAQKIEVDFLPDSQAVTRVGANRFAWYLSIAVMSFFVLFLFWSNQAVVEEVTRGEGSVIPSGRVQVVQNLEGGILSEMLVADGQIVRRGDVLLRISNTVAASDFRDLRTQYNNLKGVIARLEAEAFDRSLTFPDDVRREAPDVVRNEEALHRSRTLQLQSQVAVLRDQIAQRQNEMTEAQGRIESLQRSIALAREERSITAPLVTQGVAARMDLVRIERQIADLDGQLSNVRLTVPRNQSALNEAQRRVEERLATFRNDARAELNQRQAQFASVDEKIQAFEDRVQRTEVRSPVRGTIKEVKVNTVGGVIRPGQDLIEIVPLEDTLLVEARVRPADIAFLHPGQKSTVKITAYDYSIYGSLNGQIEQISADSIKDEKGESFFRVRVRTDKAQIGNEANPLPIIPGMTATVEILTGQKTVLAYIMKPLLKARERALTER